MLKSVCLSVVWVTAGYAVVMFQGPAGILFSMVLQPIWMVFCVVRMTQLCLRGAYQRSAVEADRRHLGYMLGGLVWSVCLFVFFVREFRIV